MKLDQIRYFVASAELGSFSAAASHLYVSHSSVSRSVSSLEEELGVELLVRDRKNLQLTAAGKVVLREGRELLEQVHHLQESVAQYSSRKELRVTCVGAYIPIFYDRMRIFQEEHPDLNVSIEQTEHQYVTKKLLDKQTDLVLNFSYLWPDDPELDHIVLESGSFCALMSPGHPLAAKEYLTREDLEHRDDLWGQNMFTSRPTDEEQAWDVQSIVLKVKTGNGITVVPEHGIFEFGPGCVVRPVHDDHTYQMILGWRRKNPSMALRDATRYFRACFK